MTFFTLTSNSLPETEVALKTAFACCVLGSFLSIFNIARYLFQYRSESTKYYSIMVLLVLPWFACWTFACLVCPQTRKLFKLLRGVYESFALYFFWKLINQYFGGEEVLIELIERKPEPILETENGFITIPSTKYFFYTVKYLIFQFVFFMNIVALIRMFGVEIADDGVLYNLTYALALGGLLLLLLYVSQLEEKLKLQGKFLALKGVLIIVFYQETLFTSLVFHQNEYMYTFVDWIFCMETLPLAILQMYVFKPHDWRIVEDIRAKYFLMGTTGLFYDLENENNFMKQVNKNSKSIQTPE